MATNRKKFIYNPKKQKSIPVKDRVVKTEITEEQRDAIGDKILCGVKENLAKKKPYIEQLEKEVSKIKQRPKEVVLKVNFKGKLLTEKGEVLNFQNEEEFNHFVDMKQKQVQKENDFQKALMLGLQDGFGLFGNSVISWKLNSPSVHIVRGTYVSDQELSGIDRDPADAAYFIELVKDFDNGIKTKCKKFKKYIISKWETYISTLSNVRAHDYRNIDRKSTKDISYRTLCVDILFTKPSYAKDFVRMAAQWGYRVNGIAPISIKDDNE